MQYDPLKGHGLPHDPFKAIVAPRPIGWISSLSRTGEFNLAPYSYYNAICNDPPMVMFSSQGWKDSIENISQSGEFVCNYVGEAQSEIMNATSVAAPSDIDEAQLYSITTTKSHMVKPDRVEGVWAALECKLIQIIEPLTLDGKKSDCSVVIGQVVSIFIDDNAIRNGAFEIEITKPVTRMGYLDFGKGNEKFAMPRPTWPPK